MEGADPAKPGDMAPPLALSNAGAYPREAQEFSALLTEFKKQNANVIGISPDSGTSHAKFIEKHNTRYGLQEDIVGEKGLAASLPVQGPQCRLECIIRSESLQVLGGKALQYGSNLWGHSGYGKPVITCLF